MLTYILFLFFINSLYSLDKKPNICFNCKYFIEKKPIHYSQCFLFPKIKKDSGFFQKQSTIYYLVTGIKSEVKEIYYYCTLARQHENMCGLEGNKYKFMDKI